jgi:hypothetical protein
MQNQHVRLLRAAVVSTVILALSAGAHAVAGGSLPHPALMLGLAAVTMMGVTAGMRQSLKAAPLVAVLAGGQFALHHGFILLGTEGSCTPVSEHLHHASGHAVTSCVGGSPTGHEPASVGIGAAMLLAHLAATLVTAALIARGEEALTATAAWLRPLLALPEPAVFPARTGVVVPERSYRLTVAPFLVSPPLRGPPALH